MFRKTAVAALCFAAAVAQAAPNAKWTITDVLTAWGGQAEAINNRGEVTGWKYGSNPIPGHVAFTWSNGALQELGIPAGEFASQGFGIGNNGTIVGDTNQRPAVWSRGEWTVVPLYGTLSDVNEAGAAVGAMRFPGKPDAQAAMFKDGVVTDLGTIPGGSGWSFAWGINNAGVIVGYASLPTPPFSGTWKFRAFVYENGVMTALGTLGGTSSYLYDINDSGTAVGASDTASGRMVAAIYENGTLRQLTEIPGNSAARAINERGDVVGSSDAGGWLYTHDGTLTMLAQVPEVRAAGYTSAVPIAINDRGWIAGNGYKPAEGGTAFLLTPK
jgi:probable HAF family extracellular repeat protein